MIKNIIILILILAFIAAVIFLDLPKIQKVLGLRKQIEEQKEVFSEKQILSAKIEKLTKDYEENEEDLKKVSYILPSGQDIANLIVQLEALALDGGLILEKIEFFVPDEPAVSKAGELRQQEGAVAKDYQSLTINLKLIGDYLAFNSFLRAVEENIRLMDISSIDFSTQSMAEGEILFFNFNLKLDTYYQ